MSDSEDANLLKRRGRRRLVGAIALVLAAVIVLPMVFDSEPRSGAPSVNVRIPGEDDSAFTPKVTAKKVQEKPRPAEAGKAPEKAVPKAADEVLAKAAELPPEASAPKIEVTVKKAERIPAPPPVDRAKAEIGKAEIAKAEIAKAEAAKAEAALSGEQFIVPVGAYAEPASVIEQLKAAGIPYYTESIAIKAGKITRVRAGPFGSRDAADRVQRQLKDLGLKPGNVTVKS